MATRSRSTTSPSRAPGGRKVDGLLAVPPGKGPFPAVVYLHGSGGDRTELLVPATWMAARGVVALTITMPEDAAPTRLGDGAARRAAAGGRRQRHRRTSRRGRARRRCRRSTDSRIGLVGWSSGARDRRDPRGSRPARRGVRSPLGRLAAGQRVRSAGAGEPAARDPARARDRRSPAWVAQARPGTVLLQDGRKDEVVPRAALRGTARRRPALPPRCGGTTRAMRRRRRRSRISSTGWRRSWLSRARA